MTLSEKLIYLRNSIESNHYGNCFTKEITELDDIDFSRGRNLMFINDFLTSSLCDIFKNRDVDNGVYL